MSLTNLLENLNKYTINSLWLNIQSSNCSDCIQVRNYLIHGYTLIQSIQMTYIRKSYILRYIVQILTVNESIDGLQTLGKYINMYNQIKSKLLRASIYPISILIIIIILGYAIRGVLNISIGYFPLIIILFIILAFIAYVTYMITKKFRYCLLLLILNSFLKNDISLQQFQSSYKLLYGKYPNIAESNSTTSFTRIICNIEVLSYEQLQYYIDEEFKNINEYIDSIPSGFFNITVACIGLFMLYIFYAIYHSLLL